MIVDIAFLFLGVIAGIVAAIVCIITFGIGALLLVLEYQDYRQFSRLGSTKCILLSLLMVVAALWGIGGLTRMAFF